MVRFLAILNVEENEMLQPVVQRPKLVLRVAVWLLVLVRPPGTVVVPVVMVLVRLIVPLREVLTALKRCPFLWVLQY